MIITRSLVTPSMNATKPYMILSKCGSDTSRLYLQGFSQTNKASFAFRYALHTDGQGEEADKVHFVQGNQRDNYIGNTVQTTSSQKSRFPPNPAL